MGPSRLREARRRSKRLPAAGVLALPWGTGEFGVYDTSELELSSTYQLEDNWGTGAFGGDWVVVTDGSDVMWARALDGEALLELGPSILGVSLARVEVGPEGRLLGWTQLDGGFSVIDTDTWEPVLAAAGAHTGVTQGLASQPTVADS